MAKIPPTLGKPKNYKKPVNKEEFLIPEMAPKPGRYAARPDKNRPWLPKEDHCLVMVIGAVRSADAHGIASRLLCETLGREPTYADTDRPTLAQITKDSIDLLQCRRWAMMAGHRNIVPTGIPGAPRDDVPLTWGEKEMLIRVYHRVLEKHEHRIDFDDLVKCLGRHHSGKLVHHQLQQLSANPKIVFKEEYDRLFTNEHSQKVIFTSVAQYIEADSLKEFDWIASMRAALHPNIK
jgi:hypothetical protein